MDPLPAFLGWLKSHQINLHPSLSIYTTITPSTSYTSYSIRIFQPNSVAHNTVVASIPKTICLSHRTSALAQRAYHQSLSPACAHCPLSLNPSLTLTQHVAYELTLGPASRWAPYLDLLRTFKRAHPPLFSLLDPSMLACWLTGTEVERLTRTGRTLTFDQLRHYYASHLTLPCALSLEDFLDAYALVSSRAFYIDNFHTVALVPVADLFDHSDEPDVVFVAEDVVCGQCGSLPECMHDRDGVLRGGVEVKEEDTVELESLRSLLPVCNPVSHDKECTSCQVYNSYGQLGNARLLLEYGFMIEANEHDRLCFDLDEFLDIDTERLHALERMFAASTTSIDPENELINPEPLLKVSPDAFFIDASARPSFTLWLALVCQATAGDPVAQININRHFSLVLDLLGFLIDPGPCDKLRSITIQVSSMIQEICGARLARMYRAELSIEQLLELKEALSPHETRHIMLINYIASERLLLQSCCSRWSQLAEELSDP
ncbi:hypothetical protein CROQUDRAFT_656349 [Cronartium quercuum f. sp. fusiforme G11]|uniref:SET domain-containing protein n=1 Tax=Cronartium quercuum f. sp. fusiforme G11 TaxID=708437 RepID=A0A9P6NHU0_9BASI|nr:hypothetical protein CROQUDRAFT_656349 [Cronartium quercuum f. sp. fusiforme G11]